MKKVLLTGASGFIGRQCITFLLQKGFEVHAAARSSRALDSVIWHEANLLEEGIASGLLSSVRPTHLLHLAWNTEPNRYWTAVDNYQWVQASLALLLAFAEFGGQRAVMAGTCAEYDWQYGWCAENVTPLRPATVYGVCKHALQEMFGAYGRQYGLSSAWGRIFFLYGPNEHPARLMPSVTTALLRGEPALCSEGSQTRDFMHVSDVASAFVALLDSSLCGAVNIASGEGVSIRDVVNKIADKIGRPELLRLGARATSVQEPPLLLADVRRLNNELGWRPAMSLDQGLDSTIAWWRDHDHRLHNNLPA